MFLLVASVTPAAFELTGLKLVCLENSVRAMRLLEGICSRIVRLLRIFGFFFLTDIIPLNLVLDVRWSF